MKRLVITALLLVGTAFAQHTYYVSQSVAGASDSNTSTQAQSKTTPWKDLPGSFTSHPTYTPVAGDTFIMMGCDDWPNATFPITWTWSGTSGSPITIDHDATWYNTSNCPSGWNRPIFDAGSAVMGGTECTGQNKYVVFSSSTWVTFKWIELTGYFWNANAGGSCGSNTGTLVDANNSDHITTDSWYVHNWSHGGSAGDTDHFWDIVNGGTACPNCLLTNSVINNTDSTVCGSSGTRCGGGFQWSTTNSIFNWMVNEIKPKTQGTFCGNNLSGAGHGFDSTHENIIEPVGGSGGPNYYYFCNNYIHDNASGELQFGNAGDVYYIFNNISVQNYSRSWSFPQQPGANMSLNFWNNTIVQTAGAAGVLTCNACNPATWVNVFIQNNHVITTASASYGGTQAGLFGCTDCGSSLPFPFSGTETFSNNTVITPTNATSQGYTNAETYVYSPPNSNCSGIPTNCPIGAGTNLTSSWPAGFATSDTNYACSQATVSGVIESACPQRTANARPGSGAWDAGAYEFANPTQAVQPSCSPGTGTYAGTQTITCTNPNSGTTDMCFTTNGTTPATNGTGAGCTTGTKYTAAISVSASETLKIIAGTSTLTDSTVASYTYTITASSALTVTSTDPSGGSASGVVTSSPAGISCPGTCSANFASGSNVTLTPVATSGSLFINWSTCPFSGTCVVTMSAAESVTANFCQPIAPNFCLNQTAQSTSFSIASNIVTIAANNTFPSGAYVGLSQFTTATQLNGRVLKTNGSSTTTQLVGTLYNVQNTALTESNVSTTADTTGYLQGQGWNPFYTAPFPAPNSGSTCVNGNGDPSCVLPIPATGWGPNTWAFDLAVPSGGVYGAAPTNPMVMLSDTSTAAGHGSFLPSLAGETNERNISLPDGSTPPNYMFALNQGGHLNVFSGHIDPTHCAGVPCFVSDVFTTTSPATTGVSNSWSIPQINYGIFSQLPANRPGPHQALRYTLNMVPTCGISGSPDCSIAPVLQSYVLQYSFGLPNCAAGVGCVTAAAPTNIYPLNTCPDYAHLFVGKGLGVATQIQMDDFDNNILIGVGGAGQGNLGNHSVFVISMATSPPKCTTFDTAGTSGTNLGFLNDTTGHDGTGYAVNDTFSFTEAGGVCASTVKILSISGGGGTGPVSTIAIVSGAASGCYLARGFATTTTSGSGSGLEVDVTFVGTYGSFATTWAPIASASCPPGNNTTLSCESPTTTAVTAFGLHNCSEQADGVYLGCSGSGPPPPPNPSCVGTCDFVDWQIGTTTFIYPSNSNLNGHGARGFAWSGNASNPNLWESKLPTGTDDANCTNPADCYKLFTLPNGGCASAPGGVQMHGTQPTIFNDDSEPYYVTSSINSPGVPTQVNPPGFTCAVGQQSFFTVAKPTVPGTNLGVPSWYDHWYENTNNAVANASNAFNPHTENFEGFDNIMSCSPDGVWCMGATDMNTGFSGNTGLGVDPLAAFVGTFSVMVPQGIISPTMVLFRGGILQ